MMPSIGQKAPDFRVNDQDGNAVSLAALKGKKVILYFYPKDQTPGCTAEACNLRDNYKLLQKRGYEVLGISSDNERSHKNFIAKQNLPFRLLADVDKAVHSKYGTWVEKSMYGRKYMGTARVTFVIDEKGIIEDVIEKVDTKNHSDQILSPTSGSAPEKAPKKAKPKAAAKKSAPKKKKAAKKTPGKSRK